jgi:hypothetical protein
MLKRVTGFLARSRSWTAALKIERSVGTTSRTVPGERVCERSVTPRLYLRCADGREPPTAESGSGNVVVDQGFDPSRGGRAMRTGCGPLLRVLGNGYWILVVDVAPVKLAVLNFFDLVLGVGTATEDLGAFPAVRVDPACLITAFAKFTDMSHLNHDPSWLGLTQISRVRAS